MKIREVIEFFEKIAPAFLQETYDNSGLLTGNHSWECTGILCCLDVTDKIVLEAKERNCNLIVAHHPIIFNGLKQLTGKNYVERTVIESIKLDIAIYAIHTNLDNILTGVNSRIADKLGLVNRSVLQPKSGLLRKLSVFVPTSHSEKLTEALFAAGAGAIGNYSECSFEVLGKGRFKGNSDSNPYISASKGNQVIMDETKIEVIFPVWLEKANIGRMKLEHPYEEVAFEIYPITNKFNETGSGLIGDLSVEMDEIEFLKQLKDVFGLSVIRHTAIIGKKCKKIALCGGAGSFLTQTALAAGADVYVTSDIKYHEFFDAENQLLLADIGHFESEQFTIDLIYDLLRQNFTNFAILKTGLVTNPVHYF